MRAEADRPGPAFVDVAVPLPLAEALTYAVPELWRSAALPGARVRVPVGKRRLSGVILRAVEEAPPAVEVRPIERVLDPEPILSPELLALADFAAGYYLAPIGEVLRSMFPVDLPAWGDRSVWLTDAGALSLPRSAAETELVETLREAGRMRLADLRARCGSEAAGPVLERLVEEGRVAVSAGRRRGARYVSAVELAPGPLDGLLEACGRSAHGRKVVEYLAAAGRPATVPELTAAVGCGRGVVTRLAKLGVLRQFTQVERLSIDRHVMAGGETGPPKLRRDQRDAVDELLAAIEAGRAEAFHLGGVTGSGKTEIYLRAAAAVLEGGRGAILMVPEIALVPALARSLEARFGNTVALMHSALSGPERHQEWERIRRGEARLVLGPRSAVFAPVARLGLLVVDEEQDGAYKQDAVPRYNGRDLALVRGRAEGAVVVLVSATPSLETRLNRERGKLRGLDLSERVGQGSLPEGVLVDLRSEGVVRRRGEVTFSERLRDEIAATVEAGHQVILLRNRRGYAPLLLCRACGEDMRCQACGLPRTLHKRSGRLRCHYCGSWLPAPERCPTCEEAAMEPVGTGTERVEEDFAALFPGVAADVLDRDAVRRAGGVAPVLERFRRGETRVLIGTQMVSKGHHFPRVALTAVMLADSYLGFPDFRAVERTYALLVQLAGRAGRGDAPGKVLIQTYHPEHYAIQAALRHEDERFAAEEMRFRRIFRYPPYTRMIQILVRHRDQRRGERAIQALAARIAGDPLSAGVRMSGPAPAPFEKLKNRWRFQLLLRADSGSRLRRLVAQAVGEKRTPDLLIDVDPYDLL